LYTKNLGEFSYVFIAIAAFTTMFSTTITTLDASPRTMTKATQLLFPKRTKIELLVLDSFFFRNILNLEIFYGQYGVLGKNSYYFIFFNSSFLRHFKLYINYWKTYTKRTPTFDIYLKDFKCCGIIFLIGFSIWFLSSI